MEQITTTLPGSALINSKQVQAITSISKTGLYARITPNPKRPGDYDPTFPRPVRISDNRVAWVLGEVQAWVETQIAKRDSGKLKA